MEVISLNSYISFKIKKLKIRIDEKCIHLSHDDNVLTLEITFDDIKRIAKTILNQTSSSKYASSNEFLLS